MPQTFIRTILCLSVLMAGLVLAAQEPASQRGPWKLGPSLSDATTPRDAALPGPQGGRAPFGGGFGGPGPGGSPFGGGLRGRPPADPEARAQRRALLRELLEPVTRMAIDHDGDAVHFTYADGRRVTYRTSGKSEKHQAVQGTVETETRWQRGALVRETHLDDGLRLTETFTRESSSQLVVTVTMSGGPIRRAKPVRRVYVLEEPADVGRE